MTNAAIMEYLYPLFSFGHILCICIAGGVMAAFVPLFLRRKKLENLVLLLGTVLTLTLSLSLLLYSVFTGMYDLEWYLPLHICNLFMLVYPAALLFKGKVRAFLKDYIVIGGFCGCWLEIIFPINTLPFLSAAHFATIVVWIYHIVIGTIAVYYVASGLYRRFRCYSILTLMAGLLLTARFVNPLWDVNFLFVNPALQVFPLTFIDSLFAGNGVFVFGVIVLAFSLVMHALSLTFEDFFAPFRKKFTFTLAQKTLLPVRLPLKKLRRRM